MKSKTLKMTLLAAAVSLSASVGSPGSAEAQVTNKKLGAQEFAGSIEINAPPAAVWAKLTDAAKLSGALKFEVKSGAKKLEKIGDNLNARADGDDLMITVSAVKPNAELRLALEPANGSYICAERWTLTAAGKGTKLTLVERYTESGPQSPADIEAQVKRFNEVLAALKTAAESK